MDGINDINKYFEESILKPISEKLELGEFYSIDLTHNFVNMLLTQNVPITYIRKVCGYPSIKTFLEVYNSRLQESEKEYYNCLFDKGENLYFPTNVGILKNTETKQNQLFAYYSFYVH